MEPDELAELASSVTSNPATTVAKYLSANVSPILADHEVALLVRAGHVKVMAHLERAWATVIAAHEGNLAGLEQDPKTIELRRLAARLTVSPKSIGYDDIYKITNPERYMS